MDLRLNDEQTELRETAVAFLAESFGPDRLREALTTPLGYDEALWHRIATELGWTSVHVPEAYGGLGLGHVDLAVLLEATGEVLLCAPLFSTVALGVNTILAIGSDSQRAALLPPIAEGRCRATLALAERSGRWEADGIEATAVEDADGFVLNGRKEWVVDGHAADLLLVAARSPGSRAEEGIAVFAVPSDALGLTRKTLPTMDPTRRLAELELSNVRVGAEARLGGADDVWPGLRRGLDLATIALAAEQLGGAQRCLDLAVAHAKERRQFGRPIGSFQAIKHKCADMYVEIEAARSALYYAACVADDGSDDLATNASLCKAWCSETYFHCASECIQIHGGVGFTWEYDPHLHFKRARASESWLGDPDTHRERIARAIDL